MNRLKQSAAPISSHHGRLLSSDRKSLPTLTLDTVCRRSRVILKQSRNSSRHAAAITHMANCQLVRGEAPKCPANILHNGSHEARAMNEPP